MMQTNHNSLVKQLHRTKKIGHPRNYELDSMNPAIVIFLLHQASLKNSSPGTASLSQCPLPSSPKCEGVTRQGNPPSPSPHNTHALAIRDSKERICIIYISIFFPIHVKFTAYLFLHWIPNFDRYKKFTSTESRY